MSERPAKRARYQGPAHPNSGAKSGKETIAPPRKFQDFAATHKGVVAEHVGAMLSTRDVARLMRTSKALKEAGETTFNLWDGSSARMEGAIDARKAKIKAAREKLDKAIAALGEKPKELGPWGGDVEEAERATWREWYGKVTALRETYRMEIHSIDVVYRSPHLPDLPSGRAMISHIPWRMYCVPGANVREVHLPKRDGAGGKSLRCWRAPPSEKLYAIGGLLQSRTSVLSCETRAPQVQLAGGMDRFASPCWSLDDADQAEVPDLPCYCDHAAAAWLHDKLYVLACMESPEDFHSGSSKCTFRFLCWDPSRPDAGWIQRADPLTMRSDPQMVVARGRIYILGGTLSSQKVRYGRTLASVERYDPDSDAWEAVAPMGTARKCCATAVLFGKIYAVGGHFPESDTYGQLSSAERYDPTADEWEPIPDMPGGRRGEAAAVAYNGVLYVTGGWNFDRERLDRIEYFDPRTNTWRRPPQMKTPRQSHALLVVNNRLFAFGGDSTGSVEIISGGMLDDSGWSSMPLEFVGSPPTRSRKCCAIAVRRRL